MNLKDKRRLYVAIVKLLDIYNRFDPEEDWSTELSGLAYQFQITRDELNDIEMFIKIIGRLL